MNYKKIYNQLIQFRKDNPLSKSTCCCETHHITPRYMNGNNKEYNLVNLTPREHYIAHCLLWKHYKNINSHIAVGLLTAITFMSVGRKFKYNSKLYSNIRTQLNEIQTKMCFINNGVKTIRIFKTDPLPDGYTYGILDHNFIDTFCITNGHKNKRLHKDDNIPNGWWSGNSNANSLTGKICVTDGKINKYIFKDEKIPDGFVLGTHTSTIEGMILITNGKIDKYIDKNAKLPIGWSYGSKNAEKYMLITNGIENTRILKSDKIPAGWKNGITAHYKNRNGTKRICNKKLGIQSILPCGKELTQQQVKDGWEYGMLITENVLSSRKNRKYIEPHENFKLACKNTIWINDGHVNKRIHKDQIIPNGFKKGRCKF